MRRGRTALLGLLLATFMVGLTGVASAGVPDGVAIDMVPDADGNSGGPNDTAPGATNTEECDADLAALNGPSWEPRDADPLNVVHLLCVGVTEGGSPAPDGTEVSLSSSGTGSIVTNTGAPSTNPATAPTTGGYATFYIHSTTSGLQTLTATVGSISDTGEEFWQPAQCPDFQSASQAKGKKGKGKNKNPDNFNHVVGTPWEDTLTGTGGRDVICGLDGNDTLNGLRGKDILIGGDGDDTLNGGNGKDQLFGDAGNDTLNGGNGKDKLFGEAGVDDLAGGNGKDLLDGGTEADACAGGRGKDAEEAC
ncbi:MAG: calcium-binding protein [Actinomycetota bacterium]